MIRTNSARIDNIPSCKDGYNVSVGLQVTPRLITLADRINCPDKMDFLKRGVCGYFPDLSQPFFSPPLSDLSQLFTWSLSQAFFLSQLFSLSQDFTSFFAPQQPACTATGATSIAPTNITVAKAINVVAVFSLLRITTILLKKYTKVTFQQYGHELSSPAKQCLLYRYSRKSVHEKCACGQNIL
jgi:hypothetical protein